MKKVLYQDTVIVTDLKEAKNFFQRLKGLLTKKSLPDGEGLLIHKCKQVHTIGMKFIMDAVFLTKEMEIVHLEESMPPGEISKYINNSKYVLELKAGTIDKFKLKIGNKLIILED